MKQKIFGQLSAFAVNQPSADEKGSLSASFGNVTDWGIRVMTKPASSLAAEDRTVTPFKSGDLVKIFKTITDGDVLWAGKIKLEYQRERQTRQGGGYQQQAVLGRWVHGLQAGLDPKQWTTMFLNEMPARLERDGKVIFGSLEPFAETGTEGIRWAVHEYGKSGYDGLHLLKDGDFLKTYSKVRDGAVEWQGKLDFDNSKISRTGGVETLRKPKHMDQQKWLEMSWQNRPMILTPA